MRHWSVTCTDKRIPGIPCCHIQYRPTRRHGWYNNRLRGSLLLTIYWYCHPSPSILQLFTFTWEAIHLQTRPAENLHADIPQRFWFYHKHIIISIAIRGEYIWYCERWRFNRYYLGAQWIDAVKLTFDGEQYGVFSGLIIVCGKGSLRCETGVITKNPIHIHTSYWIVRQADLEGCLTLHWIYSKSAFICIDS